MFHGPLQIGIQAQTAADIRGVSWLMTDWNSSKLVNGKPDIRFTGFEAKTGFNLIIPFTGLIFF